ncbi:Protogenin A, partial [Frankliniella fusca]
AVVLRTRVTWCSSVAGAGAGAAWGAGAGLGGADAGLYLARPRAAAPAAAPGPGAAALPFAAEPRSLVVRRGADAVLACRPGPQFLSWRVSWLKDGEPLRDDDDDDDHLLVDRDGDLVIRQVSRAEAGEYRCALRERPGAGTGAVVSRAATLSLASLSPSVQGPENVTVPAGGTARFSCSIDSVPTAKITWKKDNVPLPASSRFVSLSSGVLLISQVEPVDEGAYKCIATNTVLRRSRVSHEAVLTIGTPPEWSDDTFLSPRDVAQSTQGENISLECSVSGDHIPMWSFKKEDIWMNKTLVSLAMPGISVLTLQNITVQNSGLYNCSFKAASQIISKIVELHVLSPPSIKEAPESQTYPNAHTARFTCDVQGVPHPNITWFKNGEPVSGNGRIRLLNSKLVISMSVASDTGYYQCMAQNGVGESWGLAHLFVNSSGLPSPPYNLVCLKRGDSFIDLHWNTLPENFKAFTVHYWPTGNKHVYKEAFSQIKSVNITNLEPFTNYTFIVRSYTTRASEPSEELTCETKESVPDIAPDITLTIISPTTLNVAWTPLESRSTRGHITEYKVQWRQITRSTIKIREVSARTTNFTISELLPGGTYEIRVLARTSRGWPMAAVDGKLKWYPVVMPIQIQTNFSSLPLIPFTTTQSNFIGAEAMKLDPPYGLEAKPTSARTINLTWSIPVHLNVKYFSVYIKEVQSSHNLGSSEPQVINCTNRWVEIDDLQPNTNYELALKVFDKLGNSSPMSDKIECRTFENAPEVVKDVSWELLNSSAVKVMWKGPSGPVSHFNVSLVPLDQSQNIYILVNGSKTSTEVLGIRPFTTYHLTVSSVTQGGTGKPSVAQVVYVSNPEVVQKSGEPYLSESSGLPLITLGVAISVLALVLAGIGLVMFTWRKSRNLPNNSTTPGQISYQASGNGLHGQVPLSSFVTPEGDSSHYRYHVGSKQLDTDALEKGDSKGAEESSITLLPPGSTPTPIGASISTQNTDLKNEDGLRTSPCWSGGLLPRHLFHITENPQCDPNKNPCQRYCHERSEERNSDEMLKLLPAKPSSSWESEGDDFCEDLDQSGDLLNITQVTDVDQSFQDKSNNNNDIQKSNVSSNCNSDGGRSSRSSSILEDMSEGSSDVTEQQLLVTLSSVPIHHLATKPFIDVPKVSVVGPNG